MIDNTQKADTYRMLKVRLKKALASAFWFEALMIEYAIIEDRTSSILEYGKVCKDPYSANKLLTNKLRSIKLQIEKGHPVLSRKVDSQLIDDILTWKEERNTLVHRSCNSVYSEELAKEIAESGNDLVRRLDNDSRKVRNACRKK